MSAAAASGGAPSTAAPSTASPSTAAASQSLLSSIVGDIKNYTGDDPLRPWIQGVRKIQQSLPPNLLSKNLPRFLQKCAETFETDPRYLNDTRYIRVWIHLMDYVEDARAVLKKMEKNGIGVKRAMFYSAYALYYEKKKRFEDAERMYHLGVKNLAEPAADLQKSYDQFLQRMIVIQKRKAKLQQSMSKGGKLTSSKIPTHLDKAKSTGKYIENKGKSASKVKTFIPNHSEVSSSNAGLLELQGNASRRNPFRADDTVVVNFVGSAVVGNSEAEYACHHGLVDPTINMKEAMNDINCMFMEPLESEPMVKRSHHSKPKVNQKSCSFEVYVDENVEPCYKKIEN